MPFPREQPWAQGTEEEEEEEEQEEDSVQLDGWMDGWRVGMEGREGDLDPYALQNRLVFFSNSFPVSILSFNF